MGKALTDMQLIGRCGGCAHFQPVWTEYRGVCRLGPSRRTWRGCPSSSYRQQSQRACGRYESKPRKETEHES